MADPQEVDNLVRSLQTQPEADPGPSIYAAAMNAGPAIARQLGLFFNKGLSGNLEDAGVQMPAWSKAVGDVLHGDAANTALGVFAGPMAKTADLQALKTARGLMGKESGPSIWRALGWFQDQAKNPKFEIRDTLASLTGKRLPENVNSSIPLGQWLDHPALYRAYPHFGDIPVSANIGPGGAYTPRSQGGPHIRIGAESTYGPLSSTLHETMHGIQDFEGWPMGTSYDLMRRLAKYIGHGEPGAEISGLEGVGDKVYMRHAGEVESRNVQARHINPYLYSVYPHFTADTTLGNQIMPNYDIMTLNKILKDKGF